MNIRTFITNPFQENTFVLYDDTKEAIIIDCGAYTIAEQEQIAEFIAQEELNVVKLVHTHLHLDHIFGYKWSSDTFGMLTNAPKKDEFLLDTFQKQSDMLGLNVASKLPPKVGTYIDEGDILSFGNTQLEIFHIPGHTPGHLCFFDKKSKILMGGDCLFRLSIGRSDFPYGNHNLLVEGIKEKLLPLGDDVVVYCGHGSKTTIGFERENNPFLQ